MADMKIGKAVLELTLDGTQYKMGLDQMKNDAKDAADSVRGIGQAVDLAIFKQLGSMAASAISSITKEVIELGQRGAQVADVSDAFGDLATRAGSTADVMLGALREGFRGTVSDFKLMQDGNRALGSGLITSAADMKTLAAGAMLLADRTGGDAAEAFDTLTTAIAKGRTAALKQFGVMVDNKAATEAYAAAHHKAVGDLTDHEKAAALSAATIAKLKEQLVLAGPQTSDFGDVVAQVSASFQNLKDEVGVAIAQNPQLMAGLREIGPAFLAAFGGDKKALIQAVSETVSRLAIFLLDVAKAGVEAARFLSNAWNGLKVLFNALMQALVSDLAKVVQAFATLGAISAKFDPTGALKKTADGAKAAAASLRELAGGFNAQAKAAIDDAVKTNGALDSTKQALQQIQTTMINARTTSATSSAGVAADFGKTAAAAEASSKKTAAAAKAAHATIRSEATRTKETSVNEFDAMARAAIADMKEMSDTFAAAEKAKQDAIKETEARHKAQMNSMVGDSSAALHAMFEHSKGASSALAVADTAAAVVASFKNAGGYPWGLIPAALMAAAGAVQIAKINSQSPGFRAGTPGLDFQEFGPEANASLHGQEAVIPKGGGHQLAGEIAGAMRGGTRVDPTLAQLTKIASGIDNLPNTLKRAVRDGMMLANA